MRGNEENAALIVNTWQRLKVMNSDVCLELECLVISFTHQAEQFYFYQTNIFISSVFQLFICSKKK